MGRKSIPKRLHRKAQHYMAGRDLRTALHRAARVAGETVPGLVERILVEACGNRERRRHSD